jgi:hypothetical protein
MPRLPTCNRFKSNRIQGKTDKGFDAPLFHPHEDAWPDHFDWSVDGTVIVGLTDLAQATINTLRMNRQQVVVVRSLWVDAGRHPLG